VPQIPSGERQRMATPSGGIFGERLPDGWATQREGRRWQWAVQHVRVRIDSGSGQVNGSDPRGKK
jgi:hypothetical protein